MSYATPYINQTIDVIVDRPLGSRHPKHGFIYNLNYGYLPNTLAPDGEEIDAYILGIFEPVETFQGKCIAVIHRTNDDDDKCIVVPANKSYTDDQIKALVEFQEQFFTSEIIR